jgi:hypothetical protein
MGFRVAIGPEIVRRCFPSLHGIQRKSEKEEMRKMFQERFANKSNNILEPDLLSQNHFKGLPLV